ncbi:septum formation initiator [Sporichthya brevicatena]|uniref:Septum formation initiator n=1 Tax=Sporichthya brevicatena TaxID=171442 RepID=A0ABP3R8T6_9ACTN
MSLDPSVPPPPGTAPRPLIVTGDPLLLEDLLRLAAAAGSEPEVAVDVGAAVASWRSAPLVLVGADRVAEAARRELPRRPGVVVAGFDPVDPGVWRPALALRAEQVALLPDGESWLTDRLADAIDGPQAAGRVVCVLGGRGGAGASTLAAALAVTAASRHVRTALVDGDPLGGGLDLLLGEEQAEGLRWPDLAATRCRVTATALSRAVPRFGPLSLISWDRGRVLHVPPEVLSATLTGARRGHDLVVVDLPRRHPDPTVEAALAAGGPVLVVVPADVRSVAAAGRVVATLADQPNDRWLVVRGPSPSDLAPEVIANTLGIPLLGAVRPEPRRAARQDWGEPPGIGRRSPLAGLCGRFLDSLALGVAA